MARRCWCDRVLEMWRVDPRLRVLGRVASGIWLDLIMAIQDHGEDGVLRFGSRVGSLMELAFMIRCGETELETQITELVRRQLLQEGPDGALMLPIELGLSKRAIQARINGALSKGRPRKNAAPGQTEMVMGLPQPVIAPVSVTQAETQTRPVAVSPASSTTKSSTEGKSTSSVSPDEVVRIGDQVAQASGLDPAKWVGNYNQVRVWLQLGGSVEVILAAVQRVKARPTCPTITSLSYFDKAVRAAIAKAPAPEIVTSVGEEMVRARYRDDLAMWLMNREGPRPDIHARLIEAGFQPQVAA